MAQSFAARQTGLLGAVDGLLEDVRTSHLPTNLQHAELVSFGNIPSVVLDDGIPLHAVPGPQVATLLMSADPAAQRFEVLRDHPSAIVGGCRHVLSACSTPTVEEFIGPAIAVLDAYEAGHTSAAQGLTGALIDTLVKTHFVDVKLKQYEEYNDKLVVRDFIAYAPIWQAFQQFFPSKGDPVPATFNRHATAHTVSPVQYTPRNAVQGMMLATSLICRLDELSQNSEPESGERPEAA